MEGFENESRRRSAREVLLSLSRATDTDDDDGRPTTTMMLVGTSARFAP
jgi:hypothetical protein